MLLGVICVSAASEGNACQLSLNASTFTCRWGGGECLYFHMEVGLLDPDGVVLGPPSSRIACVQASKQGRRVCGEC